MPRLAGKQLQSSRSVASLLLVAVLLFFASSGQIPSSSMVGADDVVGMTFQASFLLLMISMILTRWKAVLRLTRELWLVLLLPALAILSSLWSQAPAASLRRGIGLAVVTVFANYVVVRFREAVLLDTLMLAGLVAALLSFGAIFLDPAVGRDATNDGAWQGIFLAKNNCAADMLLFISPLLIFSGGQRPLALWKVGLMVMGSVLLVMAHSKMAFLVGGLWLLLIGCLRVLRRFRREDAVALRAAGLPLLVGIGFAVFSELPALLASLNKGSDFGARTPIWHAVSAAIRMRPLLGFGYEAFWSIPNSQADVTLRYIGFKISNAQSGFLDVSLELGIVGLLLIALLFAKAFRDLWRDRGLPQSAWKDWPLFVLFVVLAYQTDESFLLHPYTLPWFLTLVTIAMLHQRTHSRGHQMRARVSGFSYPLRWSMTAKAGQPARSTPYV